MNEIKNNLAVKNAKPKFSVAIQSDGYKKLINNTLQNPKRAMNFIANISSAVATNPQLQECDAGTILSCALLGESLNLSPSPQLGQFYLVPFNDKARGKVATFILGWKGYVQLAMKSGFYKKLNVVSIKEGELKKIDPINEEYEFELNTSDDRDSLPTIGYFACFTYLNGFYKGLYCSKKEIENHAMTYSNGYRADVQKGTKYTFWSKDFDSMAMKTMLRKLLSKWGMLSAEMQEAFIKDTTVIKEDGSYEYFDNIDEPTLDNPLSNTSESEINEKVEEKSSTSTETIFG